MLCFEQLGTNFEHFWPKLCLSTTLLVLIGVSHPVLRQAFYTMRQGPKKLGANFEHFWPVVWPNLIANVLATTSRL